MEFFRCGSIVCVLSLAAAVAPAFGAGPRESLDLDGPWEFRIDPSNAGLRQNWFTPSVQFKETINVPGAWQSQGVGEPAGILRHNFEGTAWYRRTVTVPENWRGKRVVLHLGGAHRRVTAFVNGVELGGHDGFSSPFDLDISSAIHPGAENVIALRVENPAVAIEASPDKQKPLLPTGMLNYIGNWGGIYGSVELNSMPRTRVESVLVTSDVERRRISFRIRIEHAEGARSMTVSVEVPGSAPITSEITRSALNDGAVIEIAAPNAPLWSPDHPELLTSTIRLLEGGHEIDRTEQRFGFRELTTRGNTLLLNGRPLYLRGYGDDNVEVLSGFPPSSRATFLERLKLAKRFGFNAVRFHSMVPPAEYFEAADEVGMLVMAELPAAYTQYFFAHRDFLKRELESVLFAYRNHPSLLSLGFGNEFNLHWLKNDADRSLFLESIADFYKTAKRIAPATLIMSNDGYDMRPTDMVSMSRGAAEDRPTVRHEFGQYYCSLPDINLIDQFTGVMDPLWLKAKKKWVDDNHLESTYPIYVRNSQQLQQLGRKFQIERVRANARVTGYDYWLIVDYPGGTGEGDSWEEGWFDYLWKPKNVTPEEGRELNSPVLMMIDAGVDNRTLWAGETKEIGVRVSNYGSEAVRDGQISWELLHGENPVSAGVLNNVAVGLGEVADAGVIRLNAGALSASEKLNLVLTLNTGQTTYRNHWDYWVFPKLQAHPKPAIPVVSTIRLAALQRAYPWLETSARNLRPNGLLITDVLDSTAREHLDAGGRVWLMLRSSPHRRGAEFFPASGGAIGTMLHSHPALDGFPHDDFCDLQFYNLMNGAFPLPIDDWPANIQPIVGGIRTTSEFLSKTKNLSRVAYAVEGRSGRGKLLITTLQLRDNFDEAYPEAMTLMDSLLRYATSRGFDPTTAIPEEALRGLFSD